MKFVRQICICKCISLKFVTCSSRRSFAFELDRVRNSQSSCFRRTSLLYPIPKFRLPKMSLLH